MAEVQTELPYEWRRNNSSEATAWTCNTTNWAMTYYTNVCIPDMDVGFGSDADGPTVTVQKIGQDTSVIHTGRQCQDSGAYTGALRCFCNVATNMPMKLGAIYGDRTRDKIFDYPIEANDNVQPRPQRVRLGKGATGNCWAFKITNPMGNPFIIQEVSVALETAGINR